MNPVTSYPNFPNVSPRVPSSVGSYVSPNTGTYASPIGSSIRNLPDAGQNIPSPAFSTSSPGLDTYQGSYSLTPRSDTSTSISPPSASRGYMTPMASSVMGRSPLNRSPVMSPPSPARNPGGPPSPMRSAVTTAEVATVKKLDIPVAAQISYRGNKTIINSATARLRVIHNIVGGQEVNVDATLDGVKILSNVTYGTVSNFLEVQAGVHTLLLTKAGTQTPFLHGKFTLQHNMNYTAIVHGSMENHKVVVHLIPNSTACPKGKCSHFRFLHLDCHAPMVTVYIDGAILARDVSYNTAISNTYFEFPCGVHEIIVESCGNQVLNTTLQLDPERTYTAIATGVPGNSTYPLALILTEDSLGVCSSC